MAVFPREVGDHKRGVDDKTNSVIHPLVVAKCMVTAFVANHPNSNADTALKNPINRPGKVVVWRRKEMEISCSNVVEQKDQDKVTNKIEE